MGLADIADGIEVTTAQEKRGVATVDCTDATLEERLAAFESELPCSADEAATVLERYTAGGSVGAAGRAAGLPPVRAAKTLHLLGESVSPVGPTGSEVVRDWIAGELARSEAMELTGLGREEFALAAYVETHDPHEEACASIEGVLAARHSDSADPLSDTMSDTTDLF